MFVFVNYFDVNMNHLINLWPKIDKEGHTTFDIHELNETSFCRTQLNKYFSGTNDIPSTILAKATYGFYEFAFIVDERKESSSLMS